MLKIPDALLNKSQTLLDSQISPQNHHLYIKCLKYYLDFCKKYEHPYLSKDSLLLFIEKLKEKKQKEDSKIRLDKLSSCIIQESTPRHPLLNPLIRSENQKKIIKL
jgi:hypothetical protein